MELHSSEIPRQPDMLLEVEDPVTHKVEVAGLYVEQSEIPSFYVEASSLALSGLKTILPGRTIEDGRHVNVVPTPSGLAIIDRSIIQ